MGIMILTNNSAVYEKYRDKYNTDFKYCSYKDVLESARDYIHKGHRLLTHPLSGSVKPNETPYKTILLDENAGTFDMNSLGIIEKSMEAVEKFTCRDRPLEEDILADFMCIDLSLISNVINKL